MRYTYEIHWLRDGVVVATTSEMSREYAHGYLDRHREVPGPRLGARLVRIETAIETTRHARVLDEVREDKEADVGMVAGWPSAAQYRAAAERATRRAEVIEERERRAELRRAGQLELVGGGR